jgi:hypothetical protein
MSEAIAKQSGRTRDDKGRWLPGVPQHGGGRPKGVKHKLGQSFLNDLALHWQTEGADILKRVTKDDPATVLRVIASLIPKELALRLEGGNDGEGIVINLMGVSHPLIEKDITPAIDSESPDLGTNDTE